MTRSKKENKQRQYTEINIMTLSVNTPTCILYYCCHDKVTRIRITNTISEGKIFFIVKICE